MSDDRRPFDTDPSQLDVPRFTQPQPSRTYAPPPALDGPAASHGSRRRPVRWGRVSAVLFTLCLPPMLIGASSARAGGAAGTKAAPAAQTASATPAPPSAASVAAGTHVTLYNGTERIGLEQQAAEKLKTLGYSVSIGLEMAGLTPHSFVFHVDQPDAAAVVASSLGLNAPVQPVVANYPPVVDPQAAQAVAKTTEVVIILGEDYR